MSIPTTDDKHFAHYDSVTGIAFGPVFESEELAADYRTFTFEHWPLSDWRYWSMEDHRRVYDRWFEERVDGETGLLKDDLDGVGQRSRFLS